MSSSLARTTVGLGEVDPAGSRHMGRRSGVHWHDGRAVAGTADGRLRAFAPDGTEHWAAGTDGNPVSVASFDGGVAVGERGERGTLRLLDGGETRWRHEFADDVGEADRGGRFQLPLVVDLCTDRDRLYAAARRYERRGDERRFESVVAAFAPTGERVWTHRADASPISLDVRDDRLAVAYNRCPGDHQHGLVVLDATAGEPRWNWDPGTAGQRRVGDVSLLADGLALSCHGDYRGYVLDSGGSVRWRADLATPEQVGEETLYAYPNHVHATEQGVAFVTGNTYARDSRETEGRHPDEHTAFGYSPEGNRRWTGDVAGFLNELATGGGRLAAPCAQNFRTRDAATHALRLFSLTAGHERTVETEGVVTAAALDGERVAAVEEPVAYHDEARVRGSHRLHLLERP